MNTYCIPISKLSKGARNVLYAGRDALESMRANAGLCVTRRALNAEAKGPAVSVGRALTLLQDAGLVENVAGRYRATEAGLSASPYEVHRALTRGATLASVEFYVRMPDGKRRHMRAKVGIPVEAKQPEDDIEPVEHVIRVRPMVLDTLRTSPGTDFDDLVSFCGGEDIAGDVVRALVAEGLIRVDSDGGHYLTDGVVP